MKKYYKYILLLLLFIFFFLVPVNIFWDSAHYTSYVSILEGKLPWNSWDLVRGIVFPLIIFISNLIFGKTTEGLLILTFLFYLGMLITVKKLFDESLIIKDKKKKNILLIIIFSYLIFDPIIYGYYHALLTEFVAMTVSLVMCYLSYKWIKIDANSGEKYFLYSLIFILGTVFSWHLKQPYVSITIFPVIVATIISVTSNRKVKSIFSKICTLGLCIIFLVLSIQIWNSFLESKGVDLNSDRNITSSFGNLLIFGLNNYELSKSTDNYVKLTSKEKDLYNSGSYYLINIKNFKGTIIEQDVIKVDKNNNISATNSMIYIIKQVFKHPLLVLESYTSNYLALANIYPKVTDDNVTYYINKKLDVNYCHENCAIALSIAKTKSNISYMYENSYKRVENYEQYNDSPILLKFFFKALSYITTNLYKIIILFAPILTILCIVSNIRNKDKKYNSLLNILTILTCYSMLHLLVHVATGANIDRYAAPTYIPFIISYVLYLHYIYAKKCKTSVK